MANEHNDSLAAINAALEQKKQEKTALVEQQVSEQIAKIVKEGTLLEGMDLNKAKRLVSASPAVEQAALEVIQTLIANPKANKDSIITKVAIKYKTTADKVEQLFNAIGMFGEKDVEESEIDEVLRVEDGADKWIHDFVYSDNPKFEGKTKEERKEMALGAFYAAKKKYESEEINNDKNATNKDIKGSINEDWLPLARVHPKDVEKVRTKKSGQNYLRVVSFDQKSKEFEVVTPKQYAEGNTDNPITVSFSDVVMVNTDDMPEDGEKHSTKNTSRITKHTAKYSDDDEQDESAEVFTDEELDEELINESVQLDTARAFAASNKAGKNGSAANHKRAADLHQVAEKKHRETVVRWKEEYNNPTSSPDNKSLSKTLMKIHQKWADTHADKARYHDKAGTE